MKSRSLLLLLVSALSACDQRGVLVDNSWIVIGGKFHEQPIEFEAPEISFADNDGNPMLFLNFSKDERIYLPGIGSRDVRAKWSSDGDEIRFSIDSMRYDYRIFYPAVHNSNDSLKSEPTTAQSIGLVKAMEVYGEPFKYSISLDTLRLYSTHTTIWAVRDRRISDMFKKIRP